MTKREKIEALLREAAAAGDQRMVAMCNEYLEDGNLASRDECMGVINSAAGRAVWDDGCDEDVA